MSSLESAASKLRASKLSDQLETLNTDVDLASLNLAAHGKASFPLLERITSARIQRTIEGSSTLTIVANDYDRTLLQSGYIGKGLDVEIDGLWFRLWAWSKSGDDLTLTFIDREVAILKEWPPTNKPDTWYRTTPASSFGPLTRFHFAKRLIDDVKDILPIRFRCPALDDPTATVTSDPANDPGSQIAKGHGFPANVTITVKHKPASAAQFNTLNALLAMADRDLDANGVKDPDARRRVMIATVMTITQESDAGSDVGNDPNAVGPFQQNPADFWPATGNLIVDGGAFVTAAIAENTKNPSEPLWQLCQNVQHSAKGSLYEAWRTEATTTVDAYLGTSATGSDVAMPANALDSSMQLPDPTKGQFMRGRLDTPTASLRKHKAYVVRTVDGKTKAVVREDNWACLTRLAQEIGYRCFCVSGTVYFISDYELFHQRVAMTLKEGDPGVDTLDPDFTQGKANAQITVACRADRWKAPPGTVVRVEELGPASGRWLVASTERSLFDPATAITLRKPVASIPESAAPEHGAGQTSGTQVYSQPKQSTTGSDPGSAGSRVQIAEQLLKQYEVGWFDDNGRGLAQIQKVARGEHLMNEAGQHVDLDTRTMRVILALISNGWTIGTFAWCEDHSIDSLKGHAGGHAVDISSINGVAINRFDARALTLAVATYLHNLTGALAPWQLICGGYGNQYDADIAALCIPSAAAFDYVDSSGRNVLRQEHTNHIHVGYLP